MQIRLAKKDDIDRIVEIYSIARSFMVKTGNPRQWAEKSWPPKTLIEQDIDCKKCYVLENDKSIVAVFYYDFGNKIEPTYSHIDGKWRGADTYGVVHRIASDGSVKGAGSFCIQWALEKCKNLRIDTHPDNIVMQNLLKKFEFYNAGTIYVIEDDYTRLAFEKFI